MDKAEREVVVSEIGDLLDNHCKDCPLGNKRDVCSVNKCINECDIGLKIYKLGAKLDDERSGMSEGLKQPLTIEWYLELKAQGHLDKQISEITGYARSTITKYKKRWGLNK